MNRFKTPSQLMGGLLALAAIGCNTTLMLDDVQLEQAITTGIQGQTGRTVTAIDCPGDRPMQAGDVFTCSVQTVEGPLTVTVTQTDGAGNVHWQITG